MTAVMAWQTGRMVELLARDQPFGLAVSIVLVIGAIWLLWRVVS